MTEEQTFAYWLEHGITDSWREKMRLTGTTTLRHLKRINIPKEKRTDKDD